MVVSTDAREFTEKINIFLDDDDKIHDFTCVVKSFKSGGKPESTAIVELARMIWHECMDLILGLNSYLSDGFKIEKSVDGQLFFQSPAQEDPVPILVDERIQQVMADLSEAKYRLKEAKDTDELGPELQGEEIKNKNMIKKLQQEPRRTLREEQQKCHDKIKRVQQEAKLKSAGPNGKDRETSMSNGEKNEEGDLDQSVMSDSGNTLSKQSIAQFNTRINELESFKATHGHLNVSWKQENYRSLYSWCSSVKRSFHYTGEYNKNIIVLTEERKQRLIQMGFDFNSNHLSPRMKKDIIQNDNHSENEDDNENDQSSERDCNNEVDEEQNKAKKGDDIPCLSSRSIDAFNGRLREPKTFKAEHLNFDAVEKADESLARWCYRLMRVHRKKGIGKHREMNLNEDRIQSLRQIGFDLDENHSSHKTAVEASNDGENLEIVVDRIGNGTTLSEKSIRQFNRNFDELEKFEATHGHLDVTWRANSSLYYWCQTIRRSLHYREGENMMVLTKEQKRRLTKLGFDFDPNDLYSRMNRCTSHINQSSRSENVSKKDRHSDGEDKYENWVLL